ncbi:MAG: heavy metal-associated domain-containing protein [Nitrosospira sp.]
MAIKSTHLKVKGMHCTGCEEIIENAVGHLPGVQKVNADYVKQTVDVEFDNKSTRESGIRRVIEEKGYEFESAPCCRS